VSPDLGFPVFLGVTVLLLVAVVLTGLRGRVRPHLTLVALAVASLGTTIWFAEQLGDLYDLASAGAITPIHLTIAKITTLGYLGPVITGVMTLRDRRHRRLHRVLALSVLGLTAVTAVTGSLMLMAAERL
jgi:hypothetical protein